MSQCFASVVMGLIQYKLVVHRILFHFPIQQTHLPKQNLNTSCKMMNGNFPTIPLDYIIHYQNLCRSRLSSAQRQQNACLQLYFHGLNAFYIYFTARSINFLTYKSTYNHDDTALLLIISLFFPSKNGIY